MQEFGSCANSEPELRNIYSMEQWLPVVGYEGIYEVSDHGRVRSVERTVRRKDGRTRVWKGRVLKPSVGRREPRISYPRVSLQFERRVRGVRVHVLVLEAFVGPRPKGWVACHNDGDINNNRLSNLRWDTYSSNNHDMVTHGTQWQSRKTQCKQGHEFTLENTIVRAEGGRKCRACQSMASAKWYRQKRSAEKQGAP